MDNVILTSASQISPSSGLPLHSELPASAIEALVATPLEPVEQTVVDGNFQARMDVNYQAHDVALAAAAKANGHEQTNGLKLTDHHRMEIDDGYEHPDKAKSCCSMLNKLFLALAIVCFALFLCSIAFIVANLDGLNGKHGLSRIPYPYQISDSSLPVDQLINEPYFNLTHSTKSGIIVVLARHGAAVSDVLIPFTDSNGLKQYRSIVIRGNSVNHFGSVRFGFDEEVNAMNMTAQLPLNYPLFNAYNENWLMYADPNSPSHVRFVHGFSEVTYEFSSSNNNELMMTTMVSPAVNEQIIVDPTNNIYWNLRGSGNLNTHHLNLSVSTPIDIETTEQMQQNQLIQGQPVNQLNNVTDYFYKLTRAGIGKNYIATLSESETKTTLNIFADHTGMIIDPFGVGSSNQNATMYGIRLSPKQSPVYQPMSIYGSTLVVHPSKAIHTTWWQFEY